jgi:hypothetical protein
MRVTISCQHLPNYYLLSNVKNGKVTQLFFCAKFSAHELLPLGGLIMQNFALIILFFSARRNKVMMLQIG